MRKIDSNNAAKEHLFDKPLANMLIKFFHYQNVQSIIDLRADICHYAEAFKASVI